MFINSPATWKKREQLFGGEKKVQHRTKMSQAVERFVNYCPNVSLTHFHLEIILIMDLHKTSGLQLVMQQLYFPTSVFKTKI